MPGSKLPIHLNRKILIDESIYPLWEVLRLSTLKDIAIIAAAIHSKSLRRLNDSELAVQPIPLKGQTTGIFFGNKNARQTQILLRYLKQMMEVFLLCLFCMSKCVGHQNHFRDFVCWDYICKKKYGLISSWLDWAMAAIFLRRYPMEISDRYRSKRFYIRRSFWKRLQPSEKLYLKLLYKVAKFSLKFLIGEVSKEVYITLAALAWSITPEDWHLVAVAVVPVRHCATKIEHKCFKKKRVASHHLVLFLQ